MVFRKLRVKFYNWRKKKFRENLYNSIVNYSLSRNFENDENLAFKYIRENGLTIFPYPYTKNYLNLEVKVYFENEFPYVFHSGNRFFFKRGWSESKIINYYRGLLMEQDKNSPHLYCCGEVEVDVEDTLIDIGVAEGSFSIDNINNAKEIYIFEKDEMWVEALKKTFEPFLKKVKIIGKYVGEINNESYVTLDSFPELLTKKLFIKIDVDGSESAVLKGMKNLLLSNPNIKISICTYHKQDDFRVFSKFFKDMGYSLKFSNGFMIYYYDKKIQKPFLRRGVLRAYREHFL